MSQLFLLLPSHAVRRFEIVADKRMPIFGSCRTTVDGQEKQQQCVGIHIFGILYIII